MTVAEQLLPCSEFQFDTMDVGVAAPYSGKHDEWLLAKRFDRIAQTFYIERHGGDTALDYLIYPALWKMINGSLDRPVVVADFASGTGAFTHELIKRYGDLTEGFGHDMNKELLKQIVNIDISSNMLTIAQRHILDPRVIFHRSSITSMPHVPDSYFDLGVSVYGLDYTNIGMAFAEMSRVITSHGRLILVLTHPKRNAEYLVHGNADKDYQGWVTECWPGYNQPVIKQYYSLDKWIKLIELSNFSLNNILEPVPDDIEKLPTKLAIKYGQEEHRVLMIDLENNK